MGGMLHSKIEWHAVYRSHVTSIECWNNNKNGILPHNRLWYSRVPNATRIISTLTLPQLCLCGSVLFLASLRQKVVLQECSRSYSVFNRDKIYVQDAYSVSPIFLVAKKFRFISNKGHIFSYLLFNES